MARVLRLPDRGRLLVCTDLQGCMRDFQRMVELFEQALLQYQGDAHLIFTGDLIPDKADRNHGSTRKRQRAVTPVEQKPVDVR